MGLHICNNCQYNDNCNHRWKQDYICMAHNLNIKMEQENRYTKELKQESNLIEYMLKEVE